MFVHSGASYHGHEFSNTLPRSAQSSQRRSPLRRAAYSTPNSLSTALQGSSSSLMSERPLSAGEVTPRLIRERVSFIEPERDTMSEDGMSYTPSESSTTAGSTRKKRRKSSRPSTTFYLAHPAPKLKHKQRLLQIRPQLLLQLQRLSASSRPIPTLDVLPSTTLVPRLSKRFPHMFKGKNGLGANDVVCARSEDYKVSLGHDDDESDSDDDLWAHRDVVAVICQMRKDEGGARGKAGICFSDGSIWEATPISASVMEFVRTDELGQKTKARWVRRRDPRSSYSPDTHERDDRDMKFTFSIIDPNSRRHPVIASLTKSTLDIPDQYTALSAAARSKSPMFDAIDEDDDSDKDEVEEPTIHIVDERLKTLIQVTGVWVALLHGWSPNFSYNKQRPASLALKEHANSGSRTRSSSVNQDPTPRSPGETRSSTPDSCKESAGAMLRRTSNQFLHRHSPSNGSPAPSNTTTTVPRRSISTGSAFMQRAAARKAAQQPSTIPSDNEGEAVKGQTRHSMDLVGFLDSQNDNAISVKRDQLRNTSPKLPSENGRRDVQSAYLSSTKNDTEILMKPSAGRVRESTDASFPRQLKDKESRWKRMLSVFRRGHKNKY